VSSIDYSININPWKNLDTPFEVAITGEAFDHIMKSKKARKEEK